MVVKGLGKETKRLLNFCESHDIDFLEAEHSGVIQRNTK